MKPFFHENSIIETADIGEDTRVWAFVHILKDVKIGKNCNICDHCLIENGVVIGDNVTIKSGVHIWTGATIEESAFIGPSVVFTNDRHPRSKQEFDLGKIVIRKGASVGANSTILAGVEIGEYAMAGIGSVITRNIKSYALVYGNPAKQHGWIDEEGNRLIKKEEEWISIKGEKYKETANGLIKI
ncbi:MAG: DapH/DapD/GlmU-related protein [Bacteroidota bacterium]